MAATLTTGFFLQFLPNKWLMLNTSLLAQENLSRDKSCQLPKMWGIITQLDCILVLIVNHRRFSYNYVDVNAGPNKNLNKNTKVLISQMCCSSSVAAISSPLYVAVHTALKNVVLLFHCVTKTKTVNGSDAPDRSHDVLLLWKNQMSQTSVCVN